MRGDWKLVAVTPAGRRRYLRLLVPYVLACPDLDRYDIWVNTNDPGDRAFLEALREVDPRIRLVHLPDNPDPSPFAIGQFWPQACDEDTIYFRFDDDVVWLDPDFFETMLATRLARRDAFMVLPLVINNALCTYLLQTFGKLGLSRPVGPDRFDRMGWRNTHLPVVLHELFQDIVANGEVGRLACGTVPVSANQYSINSLCWFGADIAPFGGAIPEGEDEEKAFGCTIPLRLARANAVETRAVVAHYAFFTQREAMDASGLLEGYGKIAAARPELEPWRSRIEDLFARIEAEFPAPAEQGGGFTPSVAWHPHHTWFGRLMGWRGKPRTQRRMEVTRGPNF